MKKRFVSRSYCPSSSSRSFSQQCSSSKISRSSHDSGSIDIKKKKPKDADPWSINNQLEIMRLDRERTKLEKSSDQEEHKDKAEKSEQFDNEEVSQVQGVKLSTTMVKVQHELIVQSVETNQKEVVSKVATQHERKEATLEILLQNKTRSICDELSKRYFLQPDHYIPSFELLKEVEYGKKKLSKSLNDYEFQ